MKNLFIVDASGFLFRAYYAIAPMTNSEGASTNALFGFIRALHKLIRDFDAHHVVAVFDGPRNKERRVAQYAEYKANRAEAPRDLPDQINWAQEFCDLRGIPKFVIPTYEADDVMGTVARWAAQNGTRVYLCTSDKDMMQMVDDNISMLYTHKNNQVVDAAGVEEKFGVRPDQIVDWLAMTGDSSDNVPGLPGFGPKTASSLLQEFGNLDEILANPDRVKGKKKQETIRNESAMALLSRDLVTLELDVDFPKEEDYFALTGPDVSKLTAFYQKMNFNTFLKELSSPSLLDAASVTPATAPAAEQAQKETTVTPATSQATEIETKYHLVNDKVSLDALVALLSEQTAVCWDTETTAIHPLEAKLVGIGFAMEPGEAWYVPVNGDLPREQVLEALKPVFENPRIGFCAHNAKYDLHVMQEAGVDVANVAFDTMIASYLLNSHSRQHSLDRLSLELFKKVKTPIEDLIGKGKKAITMAEVPVTTVSDYCCEDVDYTCRIKQVLEPQLTERGLDQLFYDLEMPLMPILAGMERNGIYVDVDQLHAMSDKLKTELAGIEKEIHTLAGEEFNVKSPKQLGQILFEKMGINPPKKTATGYSTNADVLEQLSEEYPIAQKVIDFRTLEKLRSTYTDVLPTQVNARTQRIHCSFNQGVTATGRLSATDPNLQNIPVRTEIGRQIRKAFRPEKEGWTFLSADYSQIELRLLAHMSEDPKLVDAFQHGADIHATTASEVMDVPLEEVTKEQRYHAKAVNFGILYGQGPFGLARETGISFKEAKAFIERYFERYARVKEFIEECKEKARADGKAVTVTGRERLIPEIANKNPMLRQAAERLAVNTPLQGTAADLIKMAMLKVNKRLRTDGFEAMMILQVHDELIFEVPDTELAAVTAMVREEMEGVYNLKIPLVVDVSTGSNWMEC